MSYSVGCLLFLWVHVPFAAPQIVSSQPTVLSPARMCLLRQTFALLAPVSASSIYGGNNKSILLEKLILGGKVEGQKHRKMNESNVEDWMGARLSRVGRMTEDRET